MKHAIKTFALAFAAATLPLAPAHADIMTGEALPRVEEAICPGVMGLDTVAALQIVDRIRYNAERLGIPAANPDTCKVNLMVAFVSDGKQSAAQLIKSQPRLFQTLTVAERRELTSSSAPARAWNVVNTKTRDGMWVPQQEGLTAPAQATLWSAHSRIYVATRRDIDSSVVLFDGKQSVGLTTIQLGDYASMRGFAVDFSTMPEGVPSILALFETAERRPAELTPTDLAFLRTLYSGIPNLPNASKESTIAHDLAGQPGG